MNYIGSKKTLLPFIFESIQSSIGDISQKVFCDIFSGTGIVAGFFKSKVKKVIANDLEYYSYILLKNGIEGVDNFKIPFSPRQEEGFIYNNYCFGSGSDRMYFSDENGKYIDGIRKDIEGFNGDNYFFLLASLLEAADKVANTASVYGAFLKKIKTSADKILDFKEIQPYLGNKGVAYNEDANDLIKKISGDILYLDPPYNHRQYGSNYHILNTIAKNEIFIPSGKTGLPNYNRSLYSRKREAEGAFEQLIIDANFSDIFISYNNEGIIPLDRFKHILESHGKYELFIYDGYKRFKADNNREYSSSETIEYLHHLIKPKVWQNN